MKRERERVCMVGRYRLICNYLYNIRSWIREK